MKGSAWDGRFEYVEIDGGFQMVFRRNNGTLITNRDGEPVFYAYDIGGIVPLSVIERRESMR